MKRTVFYLSFVMISFFNVGWFFCFTILFGFILSSPCTQHSNQCEFSSDGTQLSCSGEINVANESIRSLVLCDWPTPEFDPESILRLFPSLEEISIVHSNIAIVESSFRTGLNLKKIKMSGLNLKNIPKDMFQGLQNVQMIDLRNNHLQHLDEEVLSCLPHLEEAFLAGNEWQCKIDMTWILSPNISLVMKIKDKDQLQCSNYDKKPLLRTMQLLKKLELQCPVKCNCFMDHVVWHIHHNNTLLPFYTVNCSHQGLTELPSTIPRNTTTLLLQGNKIESLELLASNELYSNVNDVYLDNNLIKSINILEGSDWLFRFRVLSLRGNLISQVPIYALDDAFAKNNQIGRVYLGHNPWHCECIFILNFQELITKYLNVFVDKNDIKCVLTDSDGKSLSVINNLAKTEACKEPIIGLHKLTGLDILNISLASLIFLILSKLLYDYLTFKKTGKLPWIVTKMP